MKAKIALMIVAISVAVVMAVSCVMPGIAVDGLKDNTLNRSDGTLLREVVTGKSFAELMHFCANANDTNHTHRMSLDPPRINGKMDFHIPLDSDVSVAKGITLTTSTVSVAPEFIRALSDCGFLGKHY